MERARIIIVVTVRTPETSYPSNYTARPGDVYISAKRPRRPSTGIIHSPLVRSGQVPRVCLFLFMYAHFWCVMRQMHKRQIRFARRTVKFRVHYANMFSGIVRDDPAMCVRVCNRTRTRKKKNR